MSKIEKNWLEWCVFAISLLLVGSVLGYLTYHTLFTTSTPPVLSVELAPAEQQHGYFVVPVTVYNRGNQTAEAVRIQVLLIKPDGTDERAEFEVPFLPPRSTRQGIVTFETDPHTAQRMVGRAIGYQMP
jgi:uncharacterized protein (TIGR02588 family)